MSRQEDVIKQNIINWCREDNIDCVDTSTDNPQFTWSLRLGGASITVYKQPRFPDRIYIQSQIRLASEHQTLVNQAWQIQQKNNMMLNMKKLSVQYNVNMDFQTNEDNLLGFNTYKTHYHSSISKADFLEKFISLQEIHFVILNSLNMELGIANQMIQTNPNSGTENPAIG